MRAGGEKWRTACGRQESALQAGLGPGPHVFDNVVFQDADERSTLLEGRQVQVQGQPQDMVNDMCCAP